MIIDQNGNILPVWYRKDGAVIKDSDNPYHMDFHVCVYFDKEQREKYAKIMELKKYLSDTDYRALKYADGCYTEEEYAPYRKERAEARAKINELDFEPPTLTREQIDEAERKAMERLKESEGADGRDQTSIYS